MLSGFYSNITLLGAYQKWCAALLVLFAIVSCQQEEDKGRMIAQVGEQGLYTSDITFLNYTPADSSQIVGTYVNNWIERQIMVQEAEATPEIDQEIIVQKVEQFRQDLLIHQLENQRIKAELDTAVTEEEIKQYYEEHEDEFQLNDYLVKVLYLKIPLDAPDIEKVARSYKLNKSTDLETVESYARMYASNFYYDIESWIYFDDLLKEIPLHDINKDRFILKRSKIRFEENGFYYFLNIVDYKLKNSTSPLSFERENIKARILNLRIKRLRESIKQALIKKGYEENKVTIY